LYLCFKMDKRDRYRAIIIISYILLAICSVILLVDLWNHLSMNPAVHIGNTLYFLVFIIFILASAIFVLHLLEENRGLLTRELAEQQKDEPVEDTRELPAGVHKVPFEVDIDLLAEEIVPRLDPRESTGDYAERILHNLARHFEIVQGVFFLKNAKSQEFEFLCAYAYTSDRDPAPFRAGEGIAGQVAKSRTILNLTSIPEGYLQIQSGLGKSSPDNLVIIPLLLNKETIGIIELASFHPLDPETEWTFKNLSKIMGNAIITKMKSAGKK
jgi:hypothetical protein